MEKFPDHIDAPYMANGAAREPSPVKAPSAYGHENGNATLSDRWAPASRRENGGLNGGLMWSTGGRGHARGHGRQKSLSDAFRTIRARNGSMSQNAHEIADALRAPVSPKLVVCSSPGVDCVSPGPTADKIPDRSCACSGTRPLR